MSDVPGIRRHRSPSPATPRGVAPTALNDDASARGRTVGPNFDWPAGPASIPSPKFDTPIGGAKLGSARLLWVRKQRKDPHSLRHSNTIMSMSKTR